MYLSLALVLSFVALCCGSKDKFRVVYNFKTIDYEYPSTEAKQADIESGAFVFGKPFPIDVDVYYEAHTGKRKVFVTTPRFQNWTPAVLGTVERDGSGNPIIRPYPSWDWFKNPTACKPNRILSAVRIMIDDCHRLWVMDLGQVRLRETICPPQLLAFDLRTNKLVVRYELPKEQYHFNSLLVTPAVDIIDKKYRCRKTFVYIAESTSGAIFVYDLRNNKSWIVADTSMIREPEFTNYSIAGSNFTSNDNILGMALSRQKYGRSKRLFYHALSSEKENYVQTSDLQNKTLFLNNTTHPSNIFHTYTGTRKTQSAAEAIDREGVLYFGLISNTSVACFNTHGEYGLPGLNSDIVAVNNETLQFISGMKVITTRFGEQYVWLVSNRYQLTATNSMNISEVNFRIQMAKVKDLRHGSNCDPKYKHN